MFSTTCPSDVFQSAKRNVESYYAAATLLLQVEMQNFVKVLFDGFESKILVVMHTEETKYLTDSISQHQQVQLINLDIQPYRIQIKGRQPFARDIVLLVMMGSRQEKMFPKWILEFRLIYTETRMIWLVQQQMALVPASRALIGFREAYSWYNLVLLNFRVESAKLIAFCMGMFDTQVNVINHREPRFQVKKSLFDYLFIKSVTNFNQRPLNIFAEADVPKVFFAEPRNGSKNQRRMVAGSDVSVAVLIGRFLNASVQMTTGFDAANVYANMTKEQGRQFAMYMEPTFVVGEETMKEALPWVFYDYYRFRYN